MGVKVENNFLKETIRAMEQFGLCPDDVRFVGSEYQTNNRKKIHYAITWDEFSKISNFDYLAGTEKRPKIPSDLVIVFNDNSKMVYDWPQINNNLSWWKLGPDDYRKDLKDSTKFTNLKPRRSSDEKVIFTIEDINKAPEKEEKQTFTI